MITIELRNAAGKLLASASHPHETLLCFDRVYESGDMIVICSDAHHLRVQMDAALLPGEVFLPQGRMTWPIPQGEHRLAYSPAAFTGTRHTVSARAMTSASTYAAALPALITSAPFHPTISIKSARTPYRCLI